MVGYIICTHNQLGLVSSINLVSFDLQCMHGPKCKLGSNCTVGRRLQEINILGGLILPVWGAVAKALAKQVCFSNIKTMLSLTRSTCHLSQLPVHYVKVFILYSTVKFVNRIGMYMY